MSTRVYTHRVEGRDVPPQAATSHHPLTPREAEVIRAIAAGHTTAEAATRLDIASQTVQSMLRVIFIKLGLRNRAQLVRWAFLNGLAEPPEPTEGGSSQ
jgi:DNA-binding NarL/FixJ family response regulator